MREDRVKEIHEEEAAIKQVEYLIGKEDFDEAERVLQRVVNHKMEDKLVKVKEVSRQYKLIIMIIDLSFETEEGRS